MMSAAAPDGTPPRRFSIQKIPKNLLHRRASKEALMRVIIIRYSSEHTLVVVLKQKFQVVDLRSWGYL